MITEVSWAHTYQLVSFCYQRCCFLTAVVLEISHTVDLNDSGEQTVAGHNSHLELFLYVNPS